MKQENDFSKYMRMGFLGGQGALVNPAEGTMKGLPAGVGNDAGGLPGGPEPIPPSAREVPSGAAGGTDE